MVSRTGCSLRMHVKNRRRSAVTVPAVSPASAIIHQELWQKLRVKEQVARVAVFAVRVFSIAIIAAVPYCIAVSKLRRPILPTTGWRGAKFCVSACPFGTSQTPKGRSLRQPPLETNRWGGFPHPSPLPLVQEKGGEPRCRYRARCRANPAAAHLRGISNLKFQIQDKRRAQAAIPSP